MNRLPLLAILFVSLSAFLLYSFQPVLAVRVRTQNSGALVDCSVVTAGDEILYDSINSIYNAPVQERWRVRDDGAIEIVDVVSSAAVMEYYRLDDYQSAGDGMFRGVPHDLSYRELMLKVVPHSRQRLVVHGKDIALYALVPQATVLSIAVERWPRVAACA